MNKEVSRRGFLKSLGFFLAATAMGEFPTLAEEPGEVLISDLVKKGDYLTHIADYYDVDISRIIEINQLANPDYIKGGQALFIPVRSQDRELPFKHLALPCHCCPQKDDGNRPYSLAAITNDLKSWSDKDNLVQGLVLYLSYKPFYEFPSGAGIFRGHTSEFDLNDGPFSGLRKIRTGERFYLARDWGGEKGRWLEVTVREKLIAHNSEEEKIILRSANHKERIILDTCLTETTDNPQDRLIVIGKITHYRTTCP
ncbi:MAG TPA: LysM peptidoglycan-binding domain-containing protein [Clostridia bacterium]|nr:LysM peptidoglycan-binding domain-containing protein [Clostridia bacterium]